jgi:hypothetical protein
MSHAFQDTTTRKLIMSESKLSTYVHQVHAFFASPKGLTFAMVAMQGKGQSYAATVAEVVMQETGLRTGEDIEEVTRAFMAKELKVVA